MKTRMVYGVVPVILLFALSNSRGRTTDGSMNMDEVLSLLLTEALPKAVEALGQNAQSFVCTSAISKKQASEGGWGFSFRSRTENTRCVGVNGKGEVVANNDASPKGGQFKNGPSLDIHKAAAVAQKTRNDNTWAVMIAVWVEDRDEWQVTLVNNQRKTVAIVVDSKGNSTKKETHPKKGK